MVYGTYNELVTGAYKPTYNWGASHCATVSSEDVPFNPERAAVFFDTWHKDRTPIHGHGTQQTSVIYQAQKK